MTPGVNDRPRNTGTLPKSNRRNERNREVISTNGQSIRSVYLGRPQHSNNLLDWQPVSDREPVRSVKNSNTRTTSSASPVSYQDFSDIAYSGSRHHNYSGEDYIQWQEMAQPVDSRAQSPPHVQGAKPKNVDRMPDRRQVESRLNQIRDYIRVTSTMMESLSQSSDPNGESADGEDSVESQLRRKMEASQRKLAELQDHQANLVGMQLRVRERLQEARQAQQALSLQENQVSNASSSPGWESENRPQQQLANSSEVLESETAALKGKLAALQNRKKQMDTLVAELQAVEMSDRASCSSDNSRYAERDKVVELETLTQQLAHLKGLMEEAARVRDNCNSTVEHTETESNTNATCYETTEVFEDEGGAAASCSNSLDRNSEVDEVYAKFNNPSERLTVDQIQAVTRELKEQQAFLQSARAELQRLKNPSAQSTSLSSAPALLLQGSTPTSSSIGNSSSEKKLSNNVNTNGDIVNGKKRQFEESVRKDQTQSSNVSRDGVGVDWSCRRGSNPQPSHSSTPANMWPVPNATAGGSNEQSVDGISNAENLLDIGPQINATENGFTSNWWSIPGVPPMAQPSNVGHGGSVEYYRQLLMGSQAQQLQMMSTTMQQCCQLLWSQQRELQSMRIAITQLQQHFRQTQNQPRITNNENHEDYSNLSRSTHHLGNTLDASLPPSSSLPNLVSLPTASSASSHPAAATSTNSQHPLHNNQQLNNQVPPGNRANNYWDNFRR